MKFLLKLLTAIAAVALIFVLVLLLIGWRVMYFEPWLEQERLKWCPTNKRGHVYSNCK